MTTLPHCLRAGQSRWKPQRTQTSNVAIGISALSDRNIFYVAAPLGPALLAISFWGAHECGGFGAPRRGSLNADLGCAHRMKYSSRYSARQRGMSRPRGFPPTTSEMQP